jgi:UDP-glucuronate decarboxylase
MLLLDSKTTQPINIGNPNEFTMRQLAELVVEITGSDSEIISIPLPAEREGDPLQRCPDINLAKSKLNWEPSVSLRHGLELMIDYFQRYEVLN